MSISILMQLLNVCIVRVVSMVAKLKQHHCAHITRSMGRVWTDKLVSFHERIFLDKDTTEELQRGLDVCQLLELPSELTCSYTHLSKLLATPNDRVPRPFCHLTYECDDNYLLILCVWVIQIPKKI